MFVNLPSRKKAGKRWATPLLIGIIVLVFLWLQWWPSNGEVKTYLDRWGTLSGSLQEWRVDFTDGRPLTLLSALFIHINWLHMIGNVVFLLIFAYPSEKSLGPWRLLTVFLVGGAIANLVASLMLDSPGRLIVGASSGVSALIGTYLALFPSARLGIVVPLGLWLEFIRLPAVVLIGVWALLQWLFTFLGPAFGHVAWWAHVSGFMAGIIIALVMRPFIKIPHLR
ncbi:MAG: rhomboid family intramembrane serine protease [Arenimonas sp.]